MKHYIYNGQLFAFAEDGSQDEHIPAGASSATAEEVYAIQHKTIPVDQLTYGSPPVMTWPS